MARKSVIVVLSFILLFCLFFKLPDDVYKTLDHYENQIIIFENEATKSSAVHVDVHLTPSGSFEYAYVAYDDAHAPDGIKITDEDVYNRMMLFYGFEVEIR